MKEQAAFFELVEHQKTIEVETNPIEDFLWWMDISKECLDGYVQNNIGYNVIPNLKKILLIIVGVHIYGNVLMKI